MIKKSNRGFTIIEVLIVLAIAGLIMLIVFLAVPALQRNSRNTQRKNDVSAVIGALQEYVNNNGGKLPTADCSATTCSFVSNVKAGYYDMGTSGSLAYDYSDAPVISASGANIPTEEKVVLIKYAKCPSASVKVEGQQTPAITLTGGTSRSVVVLYKTEGTSDNTYQCQDM